MWSAVRDDVVQNLLICVEMFFAALAHEKYYSFQQFHSTTSPKSTFATAMRELMPSDVAKDAKKVMAGNKKDD